LEIVVGARSDVGLVRTNNEDYYAVDPFLNLLVLCDGMGGQAAGEVASKMGADAILQHFREASNDPRLECEGQYQEEYSEKANRLASGIRLSNKAIFEAASGPSSVNGMGGSAMGMYYLLKNTSAGVDALGPDNVLWGTDGTKSFTLDDGWCWLFTAVDHWNAECLGWHVAKTGDRFAALQPLSMALMTRFASVGADVARGLALRMDNGTQYLSDHFQNQIKYWGIAASFAFVAEPETNGVVERFNRTLKEQVIYGHHYQNIEELRIAISDFMDRYNTYWHVEKLGFKSPRQAFDEFQLKAAA